MAILVQHLRYLLTVMLTIKLSAPHPPPLQIRVVEVSLHWYLVQEGILVDSDDHSWKKDFRSHSAQLSSRPSVHHTGPWITPPVGSSWITPHLGQSVSLLDGSKGSLLPYYKHKRVFLELSPPTVLALHPKTKRTTLPILPQNSSSKIRKECYSSSYMPVLLHVKHLHHSHHLVVILQTFSR